MYKILHQAEFDAISVVIDLRRKLEQTYRNVNLKCGFEMVCGRGFPERQIDETDKSFIKRCNSFHSETMNNVLIQESLLFNESGMKRLREEVVAFPIVRNSVGNQGADNTDVMLNDRKNPAVITQTIRQRTWEQVPVTHLVEVVSFVLSHSMSSRARLNRLANTGFRIPALLLELLKSTRQSQCGNYMLNPSFTPLPAEYVSAVGLSNTLFDADWVDTDAGFSAVMEFFGILSNAEGNYIEFSTYGNAISWNSGFETRAMALGFESDSSPTGFTEELVEYEKGETKWSESILVKTPSNGMVKIMPSHSYGDVINGVHVMDTFRYRSSFSFDNVGIKPLIIGSFSINIFNESSNLMHAAITVRRGSGLLKNKPVSKADRLMAKKAGQLEDDNDVDAATAVDNKNNHQVKGKLGSDLNNFKRTSPKGKATRMLGGYTPAQKRRVVGFIWREFFGGPAPRRLSYM